MALDDSDRRIAAVAVAAVLLAGVVGLLVRRETAGGEPATTRFSRAPSVAHLPGTIVLHGENGSAFINDNLWTEGDRQFAVWVDGRGRPIVGRRDGRAGAWHTTDLAQLDGNPLGAPTGPDAHRAYAVAVDPAGYVHVAGNMHADPLRYVRSARPLEIASWVTPPMVGADEESVTYPAFARIPGGDLLFFYRDGIAGHGDVVLNRLDGATGRWQRVGTLIDGRSSGESPYLQRIAVDVARRVLHVMFVWRAGEDADSNRDVSYLRSTDGGLNWQGSDGSARPLPVTHRRAEVVGPTARGSPVPLNQGALAVDELGRPHAVFRVRGGGSAPALHVWQEEGRWRTAPIPGLRRLAGRPALVGDGGHPLLLLWSERAGGAQLDLRAADLSDRRPAPSVSLARLAVDRWEPTFDSAAVAHGELRMLLPLKRSRSDLATGAVVTWSLDAVR